MVIKTHYTNKMTKTPKEIATNLGYVASMNKRVRKPIEDESFRQLVENLLWFDTHLILEMQENWYKGFDLCLSDYDRYKKANVTTDTRVLNAFLDLKIK